MLLFYLWSTSFECLLVYLVSDLVRLLMYLCNKKRKGKKSWNPYNITVMCVPCALHFNCKLVLVTYFNDNNILLDYLHSQDLFQASIQC